MRRHSSKTMTLYVGTSGLLVPDLEAGLLPGRDAAEGFPARLCRAASLGRAERDLLPAALGGSAARLGRADAGRLPVRGEDEPARDPLRRSLRRRHLLRAHPGARGSPRPDPRAAAAEPAARRRLARAAARLARPGARVRVRVPPPVLGRSRGSAGRERARRRRRVPVPPAARAALRRGGVTGLGRPGSSLCSTRALGSTSTSSTRTSRSRPRTAGGCSSCSARKERSGGAGDRSPSLVDDDHRDRAALDDNTAHAAENERLEVAPPARAHDDQVVQALLDPVEDRL